jgi:hypothetical protein
MKYKLFIYLFIVYLFSCLPNQKKKKIIGNEIIMKIEYYQQTNNKLPNSLLDVGVEELEESAIFYEKKDSAHYIIYYGTSLGETMIYDSNKKIWENK